MAANIGKLSKVSMVKETTYGTQITPTLPLSATAINIGNVVDTVKDPRFIGKIFTTDLIKVAQSPAGSVPLTAHPVEFGPIADATLMKSDAPAASSEAYILIYYLGTDVYAEVSKTAGLLVGASGTSHGVTPDAGFSLDTTTAPYNTAAKIAAAINAAAPTTWAAFALGNQSAAATEWVDFTYVQIMNASANVSNNAYIGSFVSVSSTTKLHKSRPAAASDTEPSFTLMEDITLGTGQAIAYTGGMVESLALKMTAKSIVTSVLNWVFFQEITGQTYPVLTIPTDNPFTALNCRYFIGGVEVTNAKDLSLTITNALDKQHVVGSEYIVKPTRGDATITIAGTVNLVESEWAARYSPYYVANNPLEMIIYCQGDYADKTNNVKFNWMIRLPSVKFSEYKTQASGPGRITSSLAGEAVVNPTIDQIEVWTTDKQTSAY